MCTLYIVKNVYEMSKTDNISFDVSTSFRAQRVISICYGTQPKLVYTWIEVTRTTFFIL